MFAPLPLHQLSRKPNVLALAVYAGAQAGADALPGSSAVESGDPIESSAALQSVLPRLVERIQNSPKLACLKLRINHLLHSGTELTASWDWAYCILVATPAHTVFGVVHTIYSMHMWIDDSAGCC